jgi:hypothetical protein
MLRGVLTMLLAIAMAVGAVLPMPMCPGCNADQTHSCCAPARQMKAGCCERVHESSAFVPQRQSDMAAADAGPIRTGTAADYSEGETGQARLLNSPPGSKPPPLVLRT